MPVDDSSLNPEAELYCSSLSILFRAALNSSLVQNVEYPFLDKFETIDIELEDGSTTVFSKLPKEQQIVFVDMLARYQASLLTQKILQVPVLEQYIAAQNGVLTDALAALFTRSGEPAMDDPEAFFADLGKRMDALAAGFSFEPTATRSTIEWDEVDYDRLFSLLAGRAKRGDLIVALPWHGHEWCLINPAREVGLVGHAEIFTKDITASTTDTENVSIGVRRDDGVAYHSLPSWRRKSYLLELCDYRIVWKWDGWNSGFKVITTPVANSGQMASLAEQYAGSDYCYWYETIAPKWFAPERFTCTTLIWWCAKNACDIRISPWFSTLVSPSDVLCDFNTRLKVVIEP